MRSNRLDFWSVCNVTLLPAEEHAALLNRYATSRLRPDPAVEGAVGRALGYLHPSPKAARNPAGLDLSCVVSQWRRLVKVPLFGQTVSLRDPRLLARMDEMRQTYQSLLDRSSHHSGGRRPQKSGACRLTDG